MRKIEQQMIAAIRDINRNFWNGDNTKVERAYNSETGDFVIRVYLHGSCIAKAVGNGYPDSMAWGFTLAGYNTPTTRSRVNTLCGAFGGTSRRGVYTKLGQAYVKRYASLVRDPSGNDTPIGNDEWF